MRAGTKDILWTGPEVAAATGGLSNTCFAASGVSIDSRSIRPGDLFIALKGPTFDGHEFVAAALAQGAAAAIVNGLPASVSDQAPLVRVEDTMAALLRLAKASRQRARGRIAAITGSVGKTGTKEALGHVLARQASVSINQGSLNNHWGLPLSLVRLPSDAAYGIFEMGMNHFGEIAPLTKLAQPDVALITIVKAVHRAHFKSTAEIADAKAEIFLGIKAGGIAVLNSDNRYFARLARAAEKAGVASILDFGAHKEAKIRLIRSQLHPDFSEIAADVAGERINYRVSIPGQHWVMNSLAVLATVRALGANVKRAATALADLQAPTGRGRVEIIRFEGGLITLIDESYNASPVSVTAAIDTLGRRRPGPGGRCIAVLGDMLELGETSPELHADLIKPLKRNRIDLVFTAGKQMGHLSDALPSAMRGGHASTADKILPLVMAAIRAGDVVMVKGSAGSRMGPIVRAVTALGNESDRPNKRRVSDGGLRDQHAL